MATSVHGMLMVNGVRLHYVERGKGTLVLLLHGFPEYWAAWRNVIVGLGEGFRAVALDTRGINLSPGPKEVSAYVIDELVTDVTEAISALGHRKAVLVGHDWGAFIAWEVAIRHPGILERLVIINAGHPGVFDQLLRDNPAQAQASRYMLAFRSSRGEELVSRDEYAGFRREILEPALASGSMSAEQAAEYMMVWRSADSLASGLNYYRANKSGPPSGDDHRPRPLQETIVNVPTLVIWGERDVYFTLENIDERLREVVPDLVVRRLPDNGHWVVHENPAEITRLISAFAKPDLAQSELPTL